MDRQFESAKSEYELACKGLSQSERHKRLARNAVLKTLPSLVDVDSVDTLVLELIPLTSRELRARIRVEESPTLSKPNSKAKRKRGVRYDEATRQQVFYAIEVEKKSVAQVMRETRIARTTIDKWLDTRSQSESASRSQTPGTNGGSTAGSEGATARV